MRCEELLERKDGPRRLSVHFADARIVDRMVEEFADVAQLVEQLIRNQ